MHACMHIRTCFSDDNRYEHGVTRSGTGMRIPVSDAELHSSEAARRTYTIPYNIASPVAKQGRMHACMHIRTCFSDDNRY